MTYLASPAAANINGEVFVVHGGVAAVMAPPTVAATFHAKEHGSPDGMWTLDAIAGALAGFATGPSGAGFLCEDTLALATRDDRIRLGRSAVVAKQRDRVAMTPDEVAGMLAAGRKVQLATINPDGYPHLVTMYYALVDGKIAFWTYRTSQKALNLARDPRISCLVETGEAYFDLRGVQIQGTVETITDPDAVYQIGLAIGDVMGNARADAAAGADSCRHQRVRGERRAQALRVHRDAGEGHLLGPHQTARSVAPHGLIRAARRVLIAAPMSSAVRRSFRVGVTHQLAVREAAVMDFKLELVIIPVTDVDRAKDFYMDQAGFRLDVDHRAGEDFRVVQLTPPGSACSVTLMRNPDAAGSVQGLHLVVTDIDAARAELTGRGVDASEVFHFGAGRPGNRP